MSEFYGDQSLIELDPIEDFDPRTGFTITRRWRGRPADVVSAYDGYVLLGIKAGKEPLDDEGGYWLLKVTFGAPDSHDPNTPLSDLWTLRGNDLDKSIWTLPKVVSELNKITDIQGLARLRSDIDNLIRGETKTTDSSGEEIDLDLDLILANTDALNMDTTIIENLIESLAKGEEVWSVSQYVLRHTLVVPSGTNIRASKSNVGKIITSAKLQQDENIPDTILFEMPDGFWLKRTPTVSQITSATFEIEQEWWNAENFDRFIYGEPIG